jgi:pectinesterase
LSLRYHPNVTLIGLGKSPDDVVITNSLNAKDAGGTFFTETAEINGTGFQADNITFQNAAGNTGQAVAVANRSDRSIFKHCRIIGHQDTLFADYGRQYYVDSYIEGGVDYIFGNAAAVFDRDQLHSNGPGFITAQSRTSPAETTGFVIFDGQVTAEFAPPNTAVPPSTIGLGRPWRAFSRVIYIDTQLPTQISAVGWNNWGLAANQATAFYAESGSSGPGASDSTRAPWAHRLTRAEIASYLPGTFLAGADHWNAVAEAAKLP